MVIKYTSPLVFSSSLSSETIMEASSASAFLFSSLILLTSFLFWSTWSVVYFQPLPKLNLLCCMYVAFQSPIMLFKRTITSSTEHAWRFPTLRNDWVPLNHYQHWYFHALLWKSILELYRYRVIPQIWDFLRPTSSNFNKMEVFDFTVS